MTSQQVEDAKLTTKQREKLPNSAFCGPDRSFPAHDCSHVRAGLSLLGRYKGKGSKSQIRECLYRKARQLNCFKSKEKDAFAGNIDTIREFYILCADGIIPEGAEGIALLCQLCVLSNVPEEVTAKIIARADGGNLIDGFETLLSYLIA